MYGILRRCEGQRCQLFCRTERNTEARAAQLQQHVHRTGRSRRATLAARKAAQPHTHAGHTHGTPAHTRTAVSTGSLSTCHSSAQQLHCVTAPGKQTRRDGRLAAFIARTYTTYTYAYMRHCNYGACGHLSRAGLLERQWGQMADMRERERTRASGELTLSLCHGGVRDLLRSRCRLSMAQRCRALSEHGQLTEAQSRTYMAVRQSQHETAARLLSRRSPRREARSAATLTSSSRPSHARLCGPRWRWPA